jgi:transcriptional regulator with XRE-family HTH domain
MDKNEKANVIFLGLGERLKNFRLSKEMTQEKFAAICGIARNNLSGIERGTRSATNLMLYNLINHFADFDANYILTGNKKEAENAATEGGEKL